MNGSTVIVGAGQAGAQAALDLRDAGFEGSITLIGEEPYPPYQRPPLSKAFLAGELERSRLFFRPEELYARQNISMLLNTRATAIDRAAKRVHLRGKEPVAYDQLLLATGSRERRVQLPGADKDKIFYLRGLDHSLALGKELRPGAKLVIMGGGYIGLEIASIAVKQGSKVTVLEAEERVLARVTAAPVAAYLTQAHQSRDVVIRTGTKVTRFLGKQSVQTVVCEDGSHIDADLVVIGIGADPSVEIAAEAGLEVDNGIVVDEYGRTSDTHIFAAGDCTNHPNSLLGERLRLESVQNALDQGRAVAHVMAGGNDPYIDIPWFWSDQYDIKLRIAGISRGYDETVLRGDPETGSFSLCYLREGILIAADTINEATDYMAAKHLIARRASIPKEILADTTQKLKKLLKRRS